MINIENYIHHLMNLLQEDFGNRLVYVGLQGSYLRGEATEHSDIDIMVVIDGLTVSDLDAYRGMILSMEHYDKSCGFICSREDLLNWNPLEIGNLLGSTKDYFGTLSDLVPAYTMHDIRNFVKMSVNNLYHEICHRYIHADAPINKGALPGTYKGVFFILQNMYLLKHGAFILAKNELMQHLEGKDRAVLERAIAFAKGESCDFADSYELLFTWCQETMNSI